MGNSLSGPQIVKQSYHMIQQLYSHIYPLEKWERMSRDFPGGPVDKTLLPVQGVQFQSLVRKLDSTFHN